MGEETNTLPGSSPIETHSRQSHHLVHTIMRPFTTPLVLSAAQVRFMLAMLATVALILFVRLIQLGSLQREVYNDIALIYRYLWRIQGGEWPVGFVLSAGPLYHYLIMPIVGLTGINYFGLKLASVIVSLGVLLFTSAFARRLIDHSFALLTLFVAGISSWLLIFSRLGNSQILVPLLVMAALWLVLRVVQAGRRVDVIACAVVSALGLYVYPQSFVLPGVTFATLIALRLTGQSVRWTDLYWFVLVTLPAALPFVGIVLLDPENFTSGYIGRKITTEGEAVAALVGNILRALPAFHVQGDSVFRSNPQELPHLDRISGVLFLLGLVFWLLPQRRRLSPVLLVPLLLLQVPAILVLSQPGEVPSASRTLGVAPIAYVLVASGLWWLLHLLRQWVSRRTAGVVIGVLLAVMLLLNMQRYFQVYISNLPYRNTSLGRLIAEYANMLPDDTTVYLVGQKWESRMPEEPSVRYVMRDPDQLQMLKPEELTCDHLLTLDSPAVLIWSFHENLPAPALEPCQDWLPVQLYTSDRGLPIFHAAPLRPGSSAAARPRSGRAAAYPYRILYE